MPKVNDGLYGSFDTAHKIGISLTRLRYWVNLDILKPRCIQCGTRRFKRYAQADIEKAISIKRMVDEDGYSLEGAIKKVNGQK